MCPEDALNQSIMELTSETIMTGIQLFIVNKTIVMGATAHPTKEHIVQM